MTIARRRTMVYLTVFVGLAAGAVLLRDLRWTGTDYSHTLLEAMAALVAFMVGALALTRYYSKKDNVFLLIGSAFVGTGCLDGYHAVATAPWLADASPSPLTALIPWSWLASRLFLSLMLWLSWLAWTREARMGEAGLINERGVYLGIGAVTLASVLFFAVVPTPSAYAEWWGLSRPQELVPAAFFLMALIGYLRKGEWRHNAYEHWLILSLLVGTMGQAAIMPTSHRLYDAPFIVNHLLKLLSYLCVLVGLTANASELFRRAETSAQEARRATDALQEAHDQLDARVRQRTDELQRLNDTLQESEQRFRTLADSAPVMIWMSDTEKHCVYLNRVWLEFTGRTLEQDLGHGWVEHVHPDERTRCRETFGAAFDARQGFVMDYRLRRHDGAYRWVLDKGVPRFTGDGQFAGFIGTCTDITERKQAEELWLNIAKGVSAATGETFFRSLVEYLAGALDADYVFVGAVLEDRADRVRTIAVSAHGAIADNFEYDLIDTPCEHVVGQRLCTYPSGVQRQFPKDAWLAEMGIDAYVGTPLFDSTGRPLGLMVALYGRALSNAHVAESVLQIFAARAASELERTRAEDALQAHELRLEQQLSALVRLMGSDALRASDVAAALRHVTETDARTLGVERVSVWRYNRDRTAIRCTELYERSANRHSSGTQLDAAVYPAYFRALNETPVVAADDAHRDPRTREFSDTYLRPLGITSMLDAPIYVNGVLDGVLCHEHVGSMRRWTPDEKTLAIATANIVSLVTEQGERKQAEDALRLSERRLELVLDATHEGVWDWNIKTGAVYYSPRWIESLGYRDEEVSPHISFWESLVHPDDMPRVREALCAHWEGRASVYTCENRLRTKAGDWRWNLDRGKVVEWDSDGSPLRMVGTDTDITDRKRAQEALTLFRSLIDHTKDTIEIIDPETGRFLDVNENACLAHGYTREEYLALTVPEIDPLVAVRTWAQAREAVRRAGSLVLDTQHRRKDGSVFPVEVNATYIFLDRDYILAVVRDVTERKRAEEVLRESQERHRLALEATNLGPWDWDLRTNAVVFSPEWKRQIGYEDHEISGRYEEWESRLHPEDRERVLAALQAYLEGRCPEYDVEFRLHHKDGSYRWIYTRGVAFRDADGKLLRMIGCHLDITERKEKEEALVIQARVLESMAEGVSLADEQGFIRYTNPAEDAMFGYRQGELIGRHVTVLNAYPQDENDRIVSDVIAQLKARGRWSGDFNNRKKDGTPFTTFAHITALEIANKTYWVCVQEDITQRKQAEEALRQSEARYKALVESAPVCIHEIDLQGRLASMNQAGLRMMGAAHEADVCGLAYLDVVAPEDRERIGRLLARAKAGEPSEFEFSTGTEQGPRRFASGFIPLKDADGTVVKVMGITRDITDQRRAEEALRQSEALFRTAFEDTAVGMALTAMDGRLRRANRFFCEMLGYAEEELSTKTFTEITHPDDREKSLRDVQRLLTGEIPTFHIEKRYLHKFDHPVWAQVSVSLTRDARGNPVHFIVQAQNITDRKRAEAALRESERRFHLLADAMPQQVWTADPDGSLDYVNQRVLDYFGRPFDQMIGWGWERVLHPDDLPECRVRWARALESGEPYEVEFRLLRASDGNYRWHLGRAIPLRNQSGRIVKWFGTNTDITDRKRLEEELRQAQKMEAIGRLAGGIAHDFNNLLTIILGQTDRLLKRLPSQDPTQRTIGEIKNAGERAAALTSRLLAFSRKQVLQPKTLSLNDLVTNMEGLLRRLIGEHITLTVRLDPELGCVKADPGQLEQVVMNLVLNARDAMPRGGTIALATKLLDIQEADAAAQAPPGRYASLVVSDTGQGMDADTQARIFEPFFTTKVLGRGTGLGLSMVYGIVAQSGGFISVRSQPGCGATFTICLPQAEEAKAPATVHPVAPDPPGGGETILLAEDEPEVREFIRDTLEEAGYRVLAARDGVDALALAEQHPAFALLLTDIVMPRLGGRDLAERLGARRPSLPILYMSGYTDDVLLPQGVQTFIQKPFSEADLLRKVRTSLEQAR